MATFLKNLPPGALGGKNLWNQGNFNSVKKGEVTVPTCLFFGRFIFAFRKSKMQVMNMCDDTSDWTFLGICGCQGVEAYIASFNGLSSWFDDKGLKSCGESLPMVTMTPKSNLHLKVCRLMFLQTDLGNSKEHLRVWDIVESFLTSNLDAKSRPWLP